MELWSYDLLEANDIAQMRKVAEDVRTMCQALNFFYQTYSRFDLVERYRDMHTRI